MAWKVGQDLLKVDVTEPEGKIEWDTYRIRTIRGKWVYAILIMQHLTWGKKSSKHGDFGFLDPIPDWCRVKWLVDQGPPVWKGLATTRIKAVEMAIANQKAMGSDDDYEDITNAEIIKKLESMLKSERTKGRKKREAKAATKRQAQGVGPDQASGEEV